MPDKKDINPAARIDPEYDYLDFDLYTLDELKAEMRQDLAAVDKMVEASCEDVIVAAEREIEKQESIAKNINKTLAKDRQRR